MADKKDFERRLKQSLGSDKGQKESGKSSQKAMDDMLHKSGLAKNVSRAEKAGEDAKGVVATHTVASGETLSHIAQKYYGSAAREDWMAIYEANKDTIGDNPSLVKPGQELKIPKK